MLPLVLPLIIFAFLAVGAAVFVVGVVVPPLRRFSLSSALWCATCGPCARPWLMFSFVLAGPDGLLIAVAKAHGFSLPPVRQVQLGWVLVIFAVCSICAVATGVAWLRQLLIHRMTFILFRLYATVVSAGIGVVIGQCLSWWLLADQAPHPLILGNASAATLGGLFGFFAFKGARRMRGTPPDRFTWISREEFLGTTT